MTRRQAEEGWRPAPFDLYAFRNIFMAGWESLVDDAPGDLRVDDAGLQLLHDDGTVTTVLTHDMELVDPARCNAPTDDLAWLRTAGELLVYCGGGTPYFRDGGFWVTDPGRVNHHLAGAMAWDEGERS